MEHILHKMNFFCQLLSSCINHDKVLSPSISVIYHTPQHHNSYSKYHWIGHISTIHCLKLCHITYQTTTQHLQNPSSTIHPSHWTHKAFTCLSCCIFDVLTLHQDKLVTIFSLITYWNEWYHSYYWLHRNQEITCDEMCWYFYLAPFLHLFPSWHFWWASMLNSELWLCWYMIFQWVFDNYPAL